VIRFSKKTNEQIETTRNRERVVERPPANGSYFFSRVQVSAAASSKEADELGDDVRNSSLSFLLYLFPFLLPNPLLLCCFFVRYHPARRICFYSVSIVWQLIVISCMKVIFTPIRATVLYPHVCTADEEINCIDTEYHLARRSFSFSTSLHSRRHNTDRQRTIEYKQTIIQQPKAKIFLHETIEIQIMIWCDGTDQNRM